MTTQQDQDNTIRAMYLRAEDMKLASSLLVQTYIDNLLFQSIFNIDKVEYEKRIRAAIREELNTMWQVKEPMIGLWDSDRLLGVACVVTPGSWIRSERFWQWRLKMLLSVGISGTRQMLSKIEKVYQAMPNQESHQIAFIAVSPLEQKKGLGHYLLRAVDTLILEHTSSKGVGIYVTDIKFEAFFAHSGYTVISQTEVDGLKGKLMYKTRSSINQSEHE